MSRNYDYGRKTITPTQQKRFDRWKIYALLLSGGTVLGVLFYLIANK